MTNSLQRFDEWLNRLLERCALEAGEDVPTYVARAVAAQMSADLRAVDSSQLEELMSHLADTKIYAETDMPSVDAVLTDSDRLEALYATGLLDSEPREAFDRITRAAAQALDVPLTAIWLVDIKRQFLLSSYSDGNILQKPDMTLDWSISQYAVAQRAPLILEDARTDPVFKHHPAVRAGIFVSYLAIPLQDDHGNAIGALCAIDVVPREWSTGHVQILTDLTALTAENVFGGSAAEAR